MGREVRRVPLSFNWPIGEVWDGYLMPKRLREADCPDCQNGYSPEAEALQAQWYSHMGGEFDPAETGSTPWTADTPQIRARADSNYPGASESVIHREAERLADHFNSWAHHLGQEDVDALIEDERLMDFTHTWSKESRWQPRDPMPVVTAAEINEWSLTGLGHDSLNCMIVIKAKCKRLGLPYVCATCNGHAGIERWPGQRAEAEAWERIEPPIGEGWQLWGTTSEGEPMTPVFETPEALADHCANTGVSWFGRSKATREQWLATFVGNAFVHVEVAPGVVVM